MTSKLKLKSKKQITRNEKTKSKESTSDTKNKQQSQCKLFQFFNDNPLDDVKEETKTLKLNNAQETTSKYFKPSSSVDRDESFADFQPEKTKKAPKMWLENKKDVSKGGKRKKNTEKCRNKDQTNDLGVYTAQFEDVCAASGVDVNPEHLQLAVAMSLSLNDAGNSPSQSSSSQSYVNEDEKVQKIRKTLLEYGFKVPTGPICANPLSKRRKIAGSNKCFLLIRTAEEKKQILANAVSRIMFEDPVCKFTNNSVNTSELSSSILNEVWCRKSCIFLKETEFQDMTEEYEVFYVKNLITPSDNKVGSLLKDWSKIPGRDPSPERTKTSFDLGECELYPKELDMLLSSCCLHIVNRIEQIKSQSFSPVEVVKDADEQLRSKETSSVMNVIQEITVDSRSCSPELFGKDSFYGNDLNDKRSLNENVKCMQVSQTDEASNDSLPDVYVSQMSKPKCLQKEELDDEVICVEEYVNRSSQSASRILSDCSIDLTQKDFDSGDEVCRKEPLFIDETVRESAISEELMPLSETLDNQKDEESEISSEWTYREDTVAKRKIASLGSIEDTLRFEAALNEYNQCIPPENTDSIDLTIEETDSDISIHSSQRYSQIYKNDNGILHFESYHEAGGKMDLSDASSETGGYYELNKRKRSDNLDGDSAKSVDKPKNMRTDDDHETKANVESQNVSIDLFSDAEDCEMEPRTSVQFKNVHNLSESVLSDDSIHENSKLDKGAEDFDVQMRDEVGSKEIVSFDDGAEKNVEIATNDIHFTQAVNEPDKSDEVFVISDEEFNYSVNLSALKGSYYKSKTNLNNISDSEDSTGPNDRSIVDDCRDKVNDCEIPNDFDLYGSSIFDQIPSYHASRISSLSNRNSRISSLKDKFLESDDILPNVEASINSKRSPVKKCSKPDTGLNILNCGDSPVAGTSSFVKNLVNSDNTPKNDNLIIKVDNVTPAVDYGAMNTPQMHKELAKFGLKPLKRKRAVQLLEHIYNQTHPVVDARELGTKLKKRKLLKSFQNTSSPISRVGSIEKENYRDEIDGDLEEIVSADEDSIPSTSKENSIEDIYRVDNNARVDIRRLNCDGEQLYFQTKEKSKVSGCRVPLHVAFHNYVSVRSGLRCALLRYHPVNIDLIHKGLVADGYRYNPKDLFQFLDKKCITVKTTNKNGGTRQKKR